MTWGFSMKPLGLNGSSGRYNTNMRKGSTHTPDTRARMSATRRGVSRKPLSALTKEKIRATQVGKFVPPETRERQRLAHIGKKQSPETIAKRVRYGSKHQNWIADRSTLRKKQERNDSAYHDWRHQVYERDGFVCKIKNSDCGGRIEAHHILGWSNYPELRYQVNNGITLCRNHHPRKPDEEKKLSSYFMELVDRTPICL